MPQRIIYMGTPEFAVPALQSLAQRSDIDLALVVTQPDRPSGRGRKMTPPAIKIAANELGLDCLQTPTLRDPSIKDRIRAVQPDLIVVAAFGMILGSWILELPTHGCINLHASLLPKYRGASPISAAILEGDSETGVTLMKMDRRLDTGDILFTRSIPIESTDTTVSLTPKLAVCAAQLLDNNLTAILNGTAHPVPQPAGATETRQLSKDDGRIDWQQSAMQIERHVRAMWDWPRAWCQLPGGERLQIHESVVHMEMGIAPGRIQIEDKRVFVGTSDGSLELLRIQLPGGKPVEAQSLRKHLYEAIAAETLT